MFLMFSLTLVHFHFTISVQLYSLISGCSLKVLKKYILTDFLQEMFHHRFTGLFEWRGGKNRVPLIMKFEGLVYIFIFDIYI